MAWIPAAIQGASAIAGAFQSNPYGPLIAQLERNAKLFGDAGQSMLPQLWQQMYGYSQGQMPNWFQAQDRAAENDTNAYYQQALSGLLKSYGDRGAAASSGKDNAQQSLARSRASTLTNSRIATANAREQFGIGMGQNLAGMLGQGMGQASGMLGQAGGMIGQNQANQGQNSAALAQLLGSMGYNSGYGTPPFVPRTGKDYYTSVDDQLSPYF